MGQYKFCVEFVTGDSIIEYTFTEYEAIILAQAEKIKAGLDYSVKSVVWLDK